MSFRVVLFDLDGTVLNTLDDLADAVNASLAKHEMPARTREEVRSFVGNGIRALIERAVPTGTDSALVARVLNEFKRYYGAHCADKTAPYAGVPELLSTLRAHGVRTAVVSNKADFAVQELAKRYFADLFDLALGERAERPAKPAPDMVHHALEALGATAAEAVYVGDSDVDVLTARNAQLPCIAVTWGFRDRACLKKAGATVFADTAKELLDLILAP
ncbi:MAG: HAD-IA family hydrolase [Clostridia bacterium]|nr:HAD-IA family hydrolase [Clostridia bacterium]